MMAATTSGGQTRLHVTAPRAVALHIAQALERGFEDDGFPLSIVEVSEAQALDEISLYASGDVAAIKARAQALIQDIAPAASFDSEILPDIDWVAHSLQGLTPVRAGRFLVHGSHDRAARRAGDLAIEIEAGLAFGTGHHATTAGCLEMLFTVARRERPRRALDLGTGSGVLAIALARLMHIAVLATDIDRVATQVAAANARLNRAGALVETVTSGGFRHPELAARAPFDLVLANVLARPLMRLAPDMARHLSPGGSVILSGILERQRGAVLAAYSGQHFRHVATLRREGWVTLHLKR